MNNSSDGEYENSEVDLLSKYNFSNIDVNNFKVLKPCYIEQIYIFINEEWKRLRNINNGEIRFLTKKNKIGEFTWEEEEEYVNIKKYEELLNECTEKIGPIYKERISVKDRRNNLIWEIDIYCNELNLIIAEVELPSEGFKFDMPDFIKNNLIIEVSGMSEFSNFELAK